MKKSVEILGAEFVLDEFHIQKYIRRMARFLGDTKEIREENKKQIQKLIENGNKKKLEEWVENTKVGLVEIFT